MLGKIHCSVCCRKNKQRQREREMATVMYSPQQKMSHWSRPAQMRANRTDHWSKLKTKSYYQTQTATGHYISYCLPQRHDSHGQQYTRRPFEMPSHFSVNQNSNPYSRHPVQPQPTAVVHVGAHGKQKQTTFGNTLALVGNPELNRQLSESGSLHLPVAQHWFAGRAGATDQGKLRRVPSASSRRAKRGFKYWTQETADGAMPGLKGTFGSRGTFLGIGLPRL